MKLKDYVTLGNVVGAFASWVALQNGHFDLACYLLFGSYIFDVLDGKVARWTGQFDTFGAHLDSVCDFVASSITVSLLVYYAFSAVAGYPWWAAASIGVFPVAFGTIRQARSMDRDLSYPCYWLGMPRQVSAFFIVSMMQSSLFDFGLGRWRVVGHAIVAVSIIAVSFLHLSYIPFVNHHKRRWMGALRFGMIWFLVGSPLVFLAGLLVLDWPGVFFDWILASLTAYILVAWTQIPKTDFERIRAYIEGGELVRPLVHRDETWRPHSVASYFERS